MSSIPGKDGPIGVIDIGSNSVRLVVYKDSTHYAAVLFNEKVLCALGKNVAKSQLLEADSIEKALKTLRRFKALCARCPVARLYVFATAAVRDAENADVFIKEAEKILGVSIHVLSGKEEAQYSAQGIQASFYQPRGLIGDLGGGSLELAYLDHHTIKDPLTLPLGGLVLQEKSKNLDDAHKIVSEALAPLNMGETRQIEHFYAVGGTWRNIAKLYMYFSDYPLVLPHAFQVPCEKLKSFLEKDFKKMKEIRSISKKRRQLLGYGAVVLLELMEKFPLKTITFSNAGVREGYLYSHLSSHQEGDTALLSGVRDICTISPLQQAYCEELLSWLKDSVLFLNVGEEKFSGLYEALTYFIYLGEHSFVDCRGTQTAHQIVYGAYYGACHIQRVFMACVLFFYYKGFSTKATLPRYCCLLKEKDLHYTKILAALMRIAGLLTVERTGVLSLLSWKRADQGFALLIPAIYQDLVSCTPWARLEELSELLGVPLSYQVTA